MRSVDEQLERVLGAAVRPAPVRLAITEAYGLRCAEEVVSPRPVPGFDMAAIDGYAVRSVDVFGAGEVVPVELPGGRRDPRRARGIRCGCSPARRCASPRVRPLPTLADAVVPVGYTDAGSARVSITRSVPSAAFVRRLGEDVQPGDIAVRRDAVLGAAQVGLLAAAGRDKVLVHPRPRVSVISVGDELVELARTPGAGQVADVCSHALTAAAREAGADTSRAGLVRGDARQIASAVQDRLPFSDMLIVCGAVGGRAGGEVQAALDALGDLDTTRVAMHPGSTQGFGRLGPDGVPTFLFPSQPATALLLFEVVARPLLRTIEGRRDVQRRSVSARLTSPVTSVKGRKGYLRGRLLREKATGDYLVQPLATSGIHLLTSLADANCLIVLPEDATDVGLDEPVTVLHLPT
jgi:molybdopterin molybdotransferase